MARHRELFLKRLMTSGGKDNGLKRRVLWVFSVCYRQLLPGNPFLCLAVMSQRNQELAVASAFMSAHQIMVCNDRNFLDEPSISSLLLLISPADLFLLEPDTIEC